ncbi:transmembrane protein 114-like [Lineus longissimus]|uniref:transmembrane protein 114-like n=1 Tax=Lineus longissimus TaxID=88925 RepID=UPI00315CC92A
MMAISGKVMEKRVLSGAAGASGFAFLLMLISVATDYWMVLKVPSGFYRNVTKQYLIGANSGLWRLCRTEVKNLTESGGKILRYCESLDMFPTNHNLSNHPEVDSGYLDYRRTCSAFAIIGLVLMVMGIFFAFYSMREVRYMFKRLTSFIFFMSALCVLVCIEVLMSSMTYAAAKLPSRIPKGSNLTYGFSFVFAWLAFIAYLAAGVVFLAYGRKKKSEHGVEEEVAEANQPLQLGRV